DDGLDLVVDLGGHLFRIGALLGHAAADEDLIVTGFKGNGADLVAHAVDRDHFPGYVGSPPDIVGRAGGNVAQDQLFRAAAAEQRRDLVEHAAFRQETVTLAGQGNGHAAGAAVGHDGDLVYRVAAREHVHH